MKRRLLSLLLCALLIVPSVLMLASCNKEGFIATASPIRPMTVTIAMITDGSTTDAAVQAAQDALNKITENTYNTHVVLKLFTEDEYEDAVEAMVKARCEDERNGKILSSLGKSEMTEVNEFGRPVTVYPEAYENQIDIFLCTSFEMFRKYLNYTYTYEEYVLDENGEYVLDENGEKVTETQTSANNIVLEELQQYIDESDAKLLGKYFTSSVMLYGKYDYRDSKNTDLYALPSNGVPSLYEYLLIDKELFDKGNFDIDNVIADYDSKDITTISDYLLMLAEQEKTTGVRPLYNVTDMGIYSMTGRHSVLGQYITKSNATPRDGFHPTNIFQVDNVKKTLTLFNDIRTAGGTYPVHTYDVDFNEKFGACYVSGDASIYNESRETGTYTVNGKEYYVVLSGQPYFDSADVTDNMWVVSSSTSDGGRAMQVLTLLNTNVQARNILLYGVENVSYYVDEDTGIVNRYTDTPAPIQYYTKDGEKVFNEDGSLAIDIAKNPRHTWKEGKAYDVVCNYKMDLYKTGNVFLAKQNSDMTEYELKMSADGWKLAKQAMSDGFFSPYIGVNVPVITEEMFHLTGVADITTEQMYEHLAKLYDEVFVRAQQYDSYVDPATGEKVDFATYLNVLRDWINADPYFKAANGNDLNSIRRTYTTFFETYFYVME